MSWNFDAFTEEVMENAERRVLKICIAGMSEAKRNMKRLAGNAPSEPWDWPARQMGDLAEHITYATTQTPEGAVGYVGVLPAIEGGELLGEGKRGYPWILEVGTPKMLPRPWMSLMMDYLEQKFGITFERDIGKEVETAIISGVLRGLFE